MNVTKATATDKPPAAAGYQMPAEWQRHAATWIGWPHNPTDWPGKFAPIQWVYGEIVRKLAPDEYVRILVNSELHEAQARRVLDKVGVDLSHVEFFQFPTNRGWTRDFGPMFVRRGGRVRGFTLDPRGCAAHPPRGRALPRDHQPAAAGHRRRSSATKAVGGAGAGEAVAERPAA